MKTLILTICWIVEAALVAIALSACQPDYSGGNKPHEMRTVEIEGCEYLEFDSGMGSTRVYSLTHKGNCKNPIHRK